MLDVLFALLGVDTGDFDLMPELNHDQGRAYDRFSSAPRLRIDGSDDV